MDKTIERYSLDMKEIFRQSNNKLENLRNKILEDKKKSDDLWETLIIKMNKKCVKVEIGENVDRDCEKDAETTPNGQENVEPKVVKAMKEEMCAIFEILKKKTTRKQYFRKTISKLAKCFEVYRHSCKGNEAKASCSCFGRKIEVK